LPRSHSHYKDFLDLRDDGRIVLYKRADHQNPKWTVRRLIFYVSDVDALHQCALAAGYQPGTSPRDAEWGERYFHIDDPDGHELSFARPLRP
jgi:uncharacterized glyoxalase superfamily protein PhnB